jgi:tRNA(Ile)-lysidine synthase
VPTRNALPERATTRFAGDVAALTGGGTADRFGVAVSGGPDSIAMLLLANAAFEGRIAAATVDHGLRAESHEEARFVASFCAAHGIPHDILTLETLPQGNVSAVARMARYDALDGWATAQGLDWVMTAHHADDQLETMVMRLNRASGVGGLAGVRKRHGRIVRPLLGWRRAELTAIVHDAGVRAVDDPSNRDDRYDRARFRKALANSDFLDAAAASASASALADADAALDWTIVYLRRERLSQSGAFWVYDAGDLPHELRRRALIDCLRIIDPATHPRGDAVERVLVALSGRNVATIGKVRCDTVQDGGVWKFTLAAPRRNS